jgi:hypothetical protein
MCHALSFTSALLDAFDPPPTPVAVMPVAHLLAERGYTPESIRLAVVHVAMFGTAECCEAIDDEDRAAVEELLPVAPVGAWERFEEHVFGLGPEA